MRAEPAHADDDNATCESSRDVGPRSKRLSTRRRISDCDARRGSHLPLGLQGIPSRIASRGGLPLSAWPGHARW